MKKKLFFFLAALILVLVAAYFILLNLPQANIKSKEATMAIPASEVYIQYSEDEAAADNTYMGKVIQISGVIDEIYEDEEGAPVVILRNSDSEPIALITMEKDEKTKLDEYSEGQSITIKALCNGLLMEVVYGKGLIVD